jgi:hypothetical protein
LFSSFYYSNFDKTKKNESNFSAPSPLLRIADLSSQHFSWLLSSEANI